jgi:hypothetical protein
VLGETALTALGVSSAAEIRALISAISDGVITAVVETVAELRRAWINGLVEVVAVISGDEAVVVLISLARDTDAPLTDVSGVRAGDGRAGVVLHARAEVTLRPLRTDHDITGVGGRLTSAVDAPPTLWTLAWALVNDVGVGPYVAVRAQ